MVAVIEVVVSATGSATGNQVQEPVQTYLKSWSSTPELRMVAVIEVVVSATAMTVACVVVVTVPQTKQAGTQAM